MNVVDSSGWLEFFADAPNADFFARPIQDAKNLIVPTLSIFEVFKRISEQRGEHDALQAVAVMQQGTVVDLTLALALDSARTSLDRRLPMADSVMLATAEAFGAVFWTQDADFSDVEGVKYIAKKRP
jgi:predicted nucleic acid-binding protein